MSSRRSTCRASWTPSTGSCDDRHDVAVEQVDLEAYAASGLPTVAMGRTIAQDPLFFAAALAGGGALAGAVRGQG